MRCRQPGRGKRTWRSGSAPRRLHANLAASDAWYVALAEALDVPLVTLDLRLASAPGPRCRFPTP